MGWSEHTARNRDAWDEIADVRAGWRDEQGLTSEFFADDGVALPDAVLGALGELRGKSCLHLQCATGEESLSLAVLGADVTAVDISPRQIEIARSKAAAAGLTVSFVVGDVLDLDPVLAGEQFDLVYTATGVLVWIPDIERWAGQIAGSLRPGGRLVLFEEHPVATCLWGDSAGIRIEADYFSRGVPLRSTGWTHFAGADDAQSDKDEFIWPLGDIVTALIGAGLTITELREYPAGAEWRFSGQATAANGLPGAFLLTAQRLAAP